MPDTGRPIPGTISRVGNLHPRPGFFVLLLFALGAIVFTILTGNRWLILFSGAAGGLLISAVAARTDLADLEVHCCGPLRAAVGDLVTNTITLRNNGARDLPRFTLEVTDPILAQAMVAVPSLAPGARASAEISRTARHRGATDCLELLAEASDPLALLRRRYWFAAQLPLRVHPGPAAAGEVLSLSAAQPRHSGTRRQPEPGGEPAGLRAWRTGDRPHSVHWRASAKSGQLVVIDYDAPADRHWYCLLWGDPSTAADEALLGTALTTWHRARQLAIPAKVLAWRQPHEGDPSLTTCPARPPAHLDWFAALSQVTIPPATQVARELRGYTGVVTVAVFDNAKAHFPAAQVHFAHQGIELRALTSIESRIR